MGLAVAQREISMFFCARTRSPLVVVRGGGSREQPALASLVYLWPSAVPSAHTRQNKISPGAAENLFLVLNDGSGSRSRCRSSSYLRARARVSQNREPGQLLFLRLLRHGDCPLSQKISTDNRLSSRAHKRPAALVQPKSDFRPVISQDST